MRDSFPHQPIDGGDHPMPEKKDTKKKETKKENHQCEFC